MVWMDVDGDEVLFNTAEGRRKAQNLRQDPRIIVSVQSRSDPQAYAVFHGKARVTEKPHIDKLAKRFLGANKYPFRQPGEKRLLVRISVDWIGRLQSGNAALVLGRFLIRVSLSPLAVRSRRSATCRGRRRNRPMYSTRT